MGAPLKCSNQCCDLYHIVRCEICHVLLHVPWLKGDVGKPAFGDTIATYRGIDYVKELAKVLSGESMCIISCIYECVITLNM